MSLAANVVRAAMRPIDRVEAFGRLAAEGATVAGIAARFGVSERTVLQRLRLRAVDPVLLEAYRAEKLDMNALQAFAVAGRIATIDPQGRIDLIEGLVRPEDIPAPEPRPDDAGVSDTDDDRTAPAVRPPAIASRPAAPDPLEDAGIGLALAEDLRHIRGAIVQAELAGNFAASFDLFVFHAARQALAPDYRTSTLHIGLAPTHPRPVGRRTDDRFAAWSPGEAMLEARRAGLDLAWLDIDAAGEAYAALRKLPDKAKRAMFAFCVARCFPARLSVEDHPQPEYEATVERLNIDFAAHVRPTAEGFFSRIPKTKMLEIARNVLGRPWASGRAGLKKQPLAREMETAFAAGDAIPSDLTAETRAAARAW